MSTPKIKVFTTSSRRMRDAPVSYRLTARPVDHGCMWPAVARRCRTQLPTQLEWAAPLVDTTPRPVVCSRPQTEALYRWLDSLPTTTQVSVCCERLREPAGSDRRIAA